MPVVKICFSAICILAIKEKSTIFINPVLIRKANIFNDLKCVTQVSFLQKETRRDYEIHNKLYMINKGLIKVLIKLTFEITHAQKTTFFVYSLSNPFCNQTKASSMRQKCWRKLTQMQISTPCNWNFLMKRQRYLQKIQRMRTAGRHGRSNASKVPSVLFRCYFSSSRCVDPLFYLN